MLRHERRIAPRFAVQVDVEMDWGSTVLRGQVTDLSEAGMFISMADPLWVGASCTARLLLNGEAVPVNLMVKRVQPLKGMGAMLVEVAPEAQAKITEYLKALQQ